MMTIQDFCPLKKIISITETDFVSKYIDLTQLIMIKFMTNIFLEITYSEAVL